MKTLLLFLLTLSLHAQPEGMVQIDMPIILEVGGDVAHEIIVPDSLTYKVGKRWMYEMKQGGIQFQAPLRKIDKIELINRDYHYFGEIKNRTIYLNKALNEYEGCKRAAIIQMLYVNNGGKVDNQTRPLVISSFNITAKTDTMFRRQYKNGYIFTYVIKNLK